MYRLLLCASSQKFIQPLVQNICEYCSGSKFNCEVIRYDYSSLAELEFREIAEIQPRLIIFILGKAKLENERKTHLFEYQSMKSIFEKVRDNSQIPILIVSTDECLFFRGAFTWKNQYFPPTVISPYFEPQNYIFSRELPQNTPIDVHFQIPLHWSEFLKTVKNLLPPTLFS